MSFDRLDKGRVLLTGATGFLGQAVLERLLSRHPQVSVVLLIRERGRFTVDARLHRLLRKPCFREWRTSMGDERVSEAVRDRIQVLDCDLSQERPTLPPDLTAVVHCAGDVTWDRPIDESFLANVQGAANLMAGIRRAGNPPHLVHVSTAFVAGFREGSVREARIDRHLDWRTELRAAESARRSVERASRSPQNLARFMRAAQRDHVKAGPRAVADAAEERRRSFVKDQLVIQGRARARSLGFPDVYTLTKALSERVVEDLSAGRDQPIPLSIVRPAIVESALSHPHPGWLDDLKMAGPVFVAFGRGLLPDLPAIPDAIVDIVPVDYVVNALLAVAANPPATPERPKYYHIVSGNRNPLPIHRLTSLAREYFEENPLRAPGEVGVARPRKWSFPPRWRAERLLDLTSRSVDFARKASLSISGGPRMQDWSDRLNKFSRRVEVARRFALLYGYYLNLGVIFEDEQTLRLHQSMSADQRRADGFNTEEINWRYYLTKVDLPGITAPLRYDKPSSSKVARRNWSPRSPGNERVAALFDLEGTLVASNVVESYLWARLIDLREESWLKELLSLACSLPLYANAERYGRAEFLRVFARRFEGVREPDIRELVRRHMDNLLLHRAWPAALRRVRLHRAAGHRTVLVTGTIDMFIEPLSPLFHEVHASRLEIVDRRATGFFRQPPIVGEARAAWLQRWLRDSGLDGARSYAYADHYSDRAFLEGVGHPVAVNPDPRLYRFAKERHWTVENWGTDSRGPVETLLHAVQAKRALARDRL